MNKRSIVLDALESVCALVLCTSVAIAQDLPDTEEAASALRNSITPDVRGDELKLKIEKGSFVVVPIPISDPTIGTALVVGAAYFYGQTEEQKNTQPASLTAGGAMYSDTDSYAAVIAQENYWHEDKWRFLGAAGYADLKLELLAPDASGSGTSVDWLLNGGFFYAHLARKIIGRWYLGVFARSVEIDQAFEVSLLPIDFDLADAATANGLGTFFGRDSRDVPTNAYKGSYFSIKALFNHPTFGSDNEYQSYGAEFSSYHERSDRLVLAWQLAGCYKSGNIPLWDTCRVGLRGFAATDYLGKASAHAQIEARWRLSQRWGVVGFAGGGYIDSSFSGVDDDDIIPSYGVGLRFMVLKSKRINMRVDYARSDNSDAIHLSVGEHF